MILLKAGLGYVGSNAVSPWNSKCFIEFVQARATVDVATGHADSDVMKHLDHKGRTGWRRLIGSPTLQIIFHKRAIKYRSLLRKMTYKDKGSYESSPPCIARAHLPLMHELLDHQSPSHAHYHTFTVRHAQGTERTIFPESTQKNSDGCTLTVNLFFYS